MANESSDKVPETAAEADALGLEKFTDEEWEKYISEFSSQFAQPFKFEPPIKCSEHPVGTKCLEVPCFQHVRAIIYCNTDHNCTDRRKYPC
jgi:hypothetical protein